MLHKRPLLTARFDIFGKVKSQVRRLQSAYERTQDYGVLESLQDAKEMLVFLESHEALFREMEIEQAMGMFKDLPHSVRTWLMFYRDQEMTL